MTDRRHRNVDWQIAPNVSTGKVSFEGAQLAVLMDIRDELQQLNAVFSCHNFQVIPRTLREIRDDARRYQGYVCRCGRHFLTSRGRASHISRTTNGQHGAVRR